MALIGEMHYLTIGGNTYSIPTGTTVEVERNLTSGTKSATIKVDGTSYDLYAPTPNAGTVTSVRVQATSPVQSSTSTAQSSSLNTTISLANGYGDTKNPYGTKTKNYVLAGPTTGSDAAPTFRALIAADIPDLSGTYLTSYTETDPVYSASAASGITSSDISNWNAKSDTDEKLKTTSVGSNTTYYPIVGNMSSTAETKYYSGNFRYSKSTGIDALQLGQVSSSSTSKGRLVLCSGAHYTYLDPPAYNLISDDKTYTLPTSSGTIALTSDIPTVPTKTSDLTNDSGFITSFTDVNVTNTAVTAATTYYLTGSTSSSTATGGLSKHAAIKAYVTANSGTGGSARIDLGNTTATTSAGGKEGIIHLYGTSATYYVELKAGAPSANRTISFPNKAGTVALTSDIPTVSYPVTSVNNKTGAVSLSASDVGALPSTTAIPSKTSDLTNDSGFLTSYTETDPVFSASAAAGITSTDISNWNAKSDTDEKVKQSRYNLINENRSILVSSVNLDGAGETVTAETYGCSYLVFNNYSQTLKITGSAGQGVLSLASDKISYQKSNYSTSILFANQTADTTLTLPNETGIVALTSDIPTVPTNVSAFTNDSGYAVINNTTVTLTTAGWSNNSQSVTVTGVTASNNVIVTAAAASESTYLNCGVKCSSQAANSLTFTCTTTPTDAIDVNVIVLTGN